MNNISDNLKKISLLALDFDGIMTDGKVYVNQDGIESVKCSRKDGLGIEMLKKHGIEVVVISKEKNPVVKARCDKLKIKFWQNVDNGSGKLDILKGLISDLGIDAEHVAYMGDDLNDFEVFGNVGISITVEDGHEKLKASADLVTKARGGDHAVREVAEMILNAQVKPLIF